MGQDIPAGEEALEWRNKFNELYEVAHSKALDREYNFLADQVNKATGGASVPAEVIAAIDPTRAEGRNYMQIDGKPLKEHPDFEDFRQEGAKPVQLNEETREWLKLGDGVDSVILQDLVKLMKQAPLSSAPEQFKSKP